MSALLLFMISGDVVVTCGSGGSGDTVRVIEVVGGVV